MDKEERAVYNRRYYAKHRDEMQEKHRTYRAEHREELRERARKYTAERHDEIQERRRANYAEHKVEISAGARRKRYDAGGQSMSENRSCSMWLGVYIAEQMLSYLFKNVTRMPIHNPGYDFKCGQGFLVDVKAACMFAKKTTGGISWNFVIKRNLVADFFLCIAFDNRTDLNPLHLWLIPGEVLSHLMTAYISETTLDKWAKYEQPIDKAIACCNAMKGEII